MRRLANFCHVFPGHTSMSIREMSAEEWRGMRNACDLHVQEMTEQSNKQRSATRRTRAR